MRVPLFTAPAVLLLAALGCQQSGAIPGAAGESLAFEFGPGDWVLANRKSETQPDGRPRKALVEFLPRGQTPADWSESVGGTFLAYRTPGGTAAAASPTLDGEARRMESGIKAVCPGARWQVLSRSDRDLVFEFRIERCAAQPDQTELGRFVLGGQGVYHFAYVAKGPPLTPGQRREWLRRLSAARLRG